MHPLDLLLRLVLTIRKTCFSTNDPNIRYATFPVNTICKDFYIFVEALSPFNVIDQIHKPTIH